MESVHLIAGKNPAITMKKTRPLSLRVCLA
jgi:hypothetical protein